MYRKGVYIYSQPLFSPLFYLELSSIRGNSLLNCINPGAFHSRAPYPKSPYPKISSPYVPYSEYISRTKVAFAGSKILVWFQPDLSLPLLLVNTQIKYPHSLNANFHSSSRSLIR